MKLKMNSTREMMSKLSYKVLTSQQIKTYDHNFDLQLDGDSFLFAMNSMNFRCID